MYVCIYIYIERDTGTCMYIHGHISNMAYTIFHLACIIDIICNSNTYSYHICISSVYIYIIQYICIYVLCVHTVCASLPAKPCTSAAEGQGIALGAAVPLTSKSRATSHGHWNRTTGCCGFTVDSRCKKLWQGTSFWIETIEIESPERTLFQILIVYRTSLYWKTGDCPL